MTGLRGIAVTAAQVVLTALVGLMAIRMAGAPSSAMAIQAGAWGLGLALAVGLAIRPRRPGPRATLAIIALLFAGLLATLGGPEIEGARRWISVGPITLHPASILVPLALWAHAGRPSSWNVAGLLGAAALLAAAQPDAAASLALLVGLLAILPTRRITATEIVPVLCAVAGAVWSWTRPDDLPAVAYVETVVASAGPAAGGAALLLMLAIPAPFVLMARRAAERAPFMAMAGLWGGFVIANLVGNYPAPVLGYGASAVVGWMISLGLAVGLGRKARA